MSLKAEAKKKGGLWSIYADIKMMERVLQDTKWKAGKDAQSVFCGLEGSQRGIDLLNSSFPASFSRCDGAIRALRAVSDFLENEEREFQTKHQKKIPKRVISQICDTLRPGLRLEKSVCEASAGGCTYDFTAY